MLAAECTRQAREVQYDYSQDPVLQYLAQKWLETDWLYNDKERVTWRQVTLTAHTPSPL